MENLTMNPLTRQERYRPKKTKKRTALGEMSNPKNNPNQKQFLQERKEKEQRKAEKEKKKKIIELFNEVKDMRKNVDSMIKNQIQKLYNPNINKKEYDNEMDLLKSTKKVVDKRYNALFKRMYGVK